MDWATIFGLAARHALTSAGGYLAGKGLLGADPASLENFVGAGMLIGGVGWSAWQKYGRVLVDINLAKARGLHPNALGFAILVAGLLAAPQPSSAADMPLKAPAPRVLQTYRGAGWYYGIHTFAENQKIAPVAGDTSNFAVGAAVGGTFGYLWGGNGVSWQALEVMASYKNTSGVVAPPVAGTPLTFDSKWSFTQRLKFGGPTEVMLAALPNMGTVFPALPTAPAGGVGTTHPYLFGAIHEDDISESIGLPLGRAWRLKGGFGLGMMQQLGKAQNNPNGATVVADVWAEYIPPSSAVTFGVPDGFVKTNMGRETRFGLSILY